MGSVDLLKLLLTKEIDHLNIAPYSYNWVLRFLNL